MKTSVPNRIGTNVLPGRTPGGFFPPITDVEIETYSEYKQPERNWKSKDHYCIMEAGNRVLERRVELKTWDTA